MFYEFVYPAVTLSNWYVYKELSKLWNLVFLANFFYTLFGMKVGYVFYAPPDVIVR